MDERSFGVLEGGRGGNAMKKRIIALLFLLLLLPGILFFAARSLPPVYQDSYYAELPALVRRMDEARGRRLILIGGSSVAFGIDVALLETYLREKGFEYTVCPLGLYAAVGTSAMLSLSESALREGDTVVLALEPAADALTAYFGATAFLKCAESDPSLFWRLGRDQQARVIGNAVPFLQEKYALVRSGQLPKAEGVYAKAAFDENCNMAYPREGNILAMGYDTGSPIALSGLAIDPSFAAQINAYCKSASKKGASVFMSFSPMNKSAVTGDANDYFTLCNETFDCPVISNPLDYILDSGWFYDSNFHLNTAGAHMRTWLLARDILAQLGCYAPLEDELPVMPAPVAAEVQAAADSGDFVFEAAENGRAYVIAGLTEQGKGKETLLLPSSYLDQPVAAVRGDALKEASRLMELHVPQSIASLPDGLLDGCASLCRLVLEHTSAPCGISAHSLDGLKDLQILVPAEAYPWYLDGYGCEENPWQAYRNQIFSF